MSAERKRENLQKNLNRKRKKQMKRSYEGAVGGRILGSWQTALHGVDHEIQADLPKLRARSRDLFRNNDYFAKFVKTVTTNVVGPEGFTLQVQGRNGNGDLDQSGNDFLESDFIAWGRVCDAAGMLTFREIQKLFVQTVVTDGEFLAMWVEGKSASNEDRLELKILDPDQLDFFRNQSAGTGQNEIRMGVEINEHGRPVFYHIASSHPNDYTYSYKGKHYLRVPADRIIHKFVSLRANQHRGVPWVAQSIARLKNISGYEEAEIINKRISASKMGFFTRNELDESYEGEGEDCDGAISMEVEPGVLESLPNGVDFKSFDPTADGTSYADFMKSMLRGVASGLNISYHTLASDLEAVSFSSARIGTLDERQTWMDIQTWMADVFMSPIYERWLRNHLAFNSGISIERFPKFAKHYFQARRWSWVDPLKDVQASTIAVENGLKSRGEIIREMGGDPQRVWEEIRKETELLKALGITAEKEAPKNPGTNKPDDDDDQDDPENDDD